MRDAALIKAWADGAQIQVKGLSGQWVDTQNPQWNSAYVEYRVKPAAVRLRVAQFADHGASLPYTYRVVGDDFQPSRNTMFIKFIGGPFEVYE